MRCESAWPLLARGYANELRGTRCRIDGLAEQLASTRDEENARTLANELAHVIWLRAEMARKIEAVGASAAPRIFNQRCFIEWRANATLFTMAPEPLLAPAAGSYLWVSRETGG